MKRKTSTDPHIKGIRIRAVLLIGVLCLTISTSKAQTYEECVQAGLSAAHAEKYDEAIDHFRQALKQSPGDIRNALTYANIAQLQVVKGEPMKAIESYDLALGIAPENLPILRAQTDLYLSLGHLSKALLGYTKVLDIVPNDTLALLNRAYIHQQQRNYHSAQTDYEKLLTLTPNNYAALLGVAILFQNAGKPQEAIQRLTLLLDQYPDKAEL